jgi:alpha-D-ribose 1-methylphosphonate 5-triphosphate synthase subunit PhnH
MPDMKKIHTFDEVFDAQKVYRLLLSAMANLRRGHIGPCAKKLYGENPVFLALAMTLLDNETGFCACGQEKLSDEIVSLTLSRPEPTARADYIFVADLNGLEHAVPNAKCGTLRDPHKSATLIVKNGGEKTVRLRLRGPGIRETAEISATETVKAALGTSRRAAL